MFRLMRLVALLLCFGPVGATAQAVKEVKPTQGPVASTPERTTASFGDWLLRCDATAATPARRVCEVALIVTVQGQTNPIAQIAVGKPSPKESNRLTVVLPPNIAITTRPQVTVAKTGATPIELIWQRCTPAACFASAPLSDESVGIFSTQAEPGRVAFKDAADREVALPLSFRGFTQAVAALAKEQ
jgi:invasion protein IalB